MLEPIGAAGATSLLRLIQSGKRNKILRGSVILAAGLLLLSGAGYVTIQVSSAVYPKWLREVCASLAGISALTLCAIMFYERLNTKLQREEATSEAISDVEKRVLANPAEPSAAWDLGRIKLENYLNRNLQQVNWIFKLTLVVMTVGFIIIGIGVSLVYKSKEGLEPAVVVTVSGLIVEFIAATFLTVYKSTMEQAKDYVNVLERINAVGMSVQILNSVIGADNELRNATRAEIALGILSLYGMPMSKKTVEKPQKKKNVLAALQ